MKKTLTAIVAAAMAAFMCGCDELPSVEKMTAISTTIGKTAAYACQLASIDEHVKEEILNVLDIASKVVPEAGQTFTDAWAPVIDEELKKLVEKGKLDDSTSAIAKLALTAATEGLDYVFVKYPKAKDVKELVGAAVDGFIAGYKSIAPLGARNASSDIDEDAYKYLKAKLAAAK